ncbi:IS6 family transposase [Bacillus anthracis]|uniref:IS6 family transposase n=1 Tax=Bacillus anthracis TaxID=1392 RepID=UPI00099CFFCC|nr:IS6 family transposase [Bacillus anthracis]
MKQENLFKGRHYPPDVILLTVYWRLKYELSFRNLVIMLKERGISLNHTTIIRWVNEYKSEVDTCIQRDQKQITEWKIHETKIKVRGQGMYLYRMVDAEGDTIDFHLSKFENYEGAKQLFNEFTERILLPQACEGR